MSKVAMNQQIKSLALECGAWHQVYSQLPGSTEKRFMVDGNFDVEKFANLIVEACARHIENSTDRHRKDYFAELVRTTFGEDNA